MDKLFDFMFREKRDSVSVELPPRVVDLPPGIIDPERIDIYRKHMHLKGADRLFEKLLENIRYVGPEDFKSSLGIMEGQIKNFVENDPFIVIYGPEDRSGKWVADQLNLSPLASLSVFDRRDNLFSKFVKNGTKVVYPDDHTISGAQVNHFINNESFPGNSINRNNLGLFFVGATDLAVRDLTKHMRPKTLFRRYKIPTMNEIFSKDELKTLGDILPGWGGTSSQAVLTFLHSSVPDNFYGPLKRSISVIDKEIENTDELYLVDDRVGGKFARPYRNNK
ncbi:MAG: hypothetical protein HYV90_00635 [Candidatus Woesebacteria bacterium]|nr:MAG: hypothetical protein HYV90_00635 [Candidatus Woesebacteria bacterium]